MGIETDTGSPAKKCADHERARLASIKDKRQEVFKLLLEIEKMEKNDVNSNFCKTEKILKEWLDNAQRNSGYNCEEEFKAAMRELEIANNTIHNYNRSSGRY